MHPYRIARPVGVALLIAAAALGPTLAQPQGIPPGVESSDEAAKSAAGADSDPTKPVLFSVREEYVDLPGALRANSLLVRRDAVTLKRRPLPGNAKGLLLRADLPFVSFDDGTDTKHGLGDLYGQALIVPQVSPGFMVALGSGLSVPTASDDKLGSGKWIAAPAVVPVWFFPKRGFAYVKLQDWISVAGDGGRADVHYTTITPTWLRRLGKQWWTLVDGESRTDWERDDETSFRGGLLVGRMSSARHGFSVKVELPFGGHQRTDWAVRTAFFRTRY